MSKNEKCTCKACKNTVFIVKCANLWGFCCRRLRGCLSPLLFNSNGELVERLVIIPNPARCAVGFCDNVKRYPDLAHVRSHVVNFTYHKWSSGPKLAEIWLKQVAKTWGNVFNPSHGACWRGDFRFFKAFSTGKKIPWKPQNGLSICFYDRL